MFKYVYLLVCVLVHASTALSIFEEMVESGGGRRAIACAGAAGGAAGRCPGLLWQRDWMLVKYSCLSGVSSTRLATVVVKTGVANCTHEATTLKDNSDVCSRRVLARYKHPLYPEVDLALLQLDHPYTNTMEGLNYTRNDNFLEKIDIWIKNILYAESIQREHMYPEQIEMNNYMKMYSTPMKMFMFTVVLPSVSFIIFFMYIIFFTGTNNNVKIPYKKFTNEKKNCV